MSPDLINADMPPPGLDWEAYIGWLVAQHGSLARLAERLGAERGGREDLESVERALRRLRRRGGLGGGEWGRRVLARFGVPPEVERQARWMGSYHTRFADLPRALCLEQLRAWDRPPLAEGPARAWLLFGLAGVALRGREFVRAGELLEEAGGLAARAGPAAQIERLLARAYLLGKLRRDGEAAGPVAEAEALFAAHAALIPADDRACIEARLADHRAFYLNVGPRRDPAAALAIYLSLPEGGPPFAGYRRASGAAWSLLGLGRREEALIQARLACDLAGDGGFVRLRAMALNLLARLCPEPEAAQHRARARAIADRLEDEELRVRVARAVLP